MTELENNFSIYLSKNGCKLGIGSNLFPLTEGTDAGDRKSYSYKDERGVDYRISWFKNDRRFGNLFIDDSNKLKR